VDGLDRLPRECGADRKITDEDFLSDGCFGVIGGWALHQSTSWFLRCWRGTNVRSHAGLTGSANRSGHECHLLKRVHDYRRPFNAARHIESTPSPDNGGSGWGRCLRRRHPHPSPTRIYCHRSGKTVDQTPKASATRVSHEWYAVKRKSALVPAEAGTQSDPPSGFTT